MLSKTAHPAITRVMQRHAVELGMLVLMLGLLSCKPSESLFDIRARLATEPVGNDPDDPAIWIHPTDPERSLILGTNKVRAPHGALVVFGLDGKARQTLDGINRPNNVDVEYGLNLGGTLVDIAVLTERHESRLRVFSISPEDSKLSDVSSQSGLSVFTGQQGDNGAPMGIGLYRRPRDGTVYAVVGRKNGPHRGYLWQYRLEDDGSGRVKATIVREFGKFSGSGEIEAIAVDDGLGYVYYADEGDGIHKWHADPDHPEAAGELAHFGQLDFAGDREGIGVYALDDGTGYILCADQIDGASEYHIYRREGQEGNPHDHSQLLKAIREQTDSTDGIDVTSANLGLNFPNGILVAMNSRERNFLVFGWQEIPFTFPLCCSRNRRISPLPSRRWTCRWLDRVRCLLILLAEHSVSAGRDSRGA